MNKNTFFYALTQFSERLLSFFLLPLLTNMVSKAEYAVWSQSIIISGIMVTVGLLGYQSAVVKFFPVWRDQKKLQRSVLLLMITSAFVILSAISLLAVHFDHIAADLIFGDSSLYLFIPLLVGMLFSEALFELLVTVLRASNRIQRVSIYLLMKGMWRLGIFLLVLIGAKGGFYSAFWSFVLFQLAITLAVYIKEVGVSALVRSGFNLGYNHWNEILRFSLPLVPLAALTAVNNFVDRLFLTHLHGLETLAVYSAVFSLAAIAAFFYSVIGFTLFPVLSEFWANGDLESVAGLMRKVFIVYLSLLFPFISFITVAGSDVLILLTSEDYLVPPYLPLLLACNIGLFGIYQIAFYIIMLEQGTARAPLLMGGVVAINILFNVLLVPNYGMYGAALAGFASNALLAGLFLKKSQQVFQWQFPWNAGLKIAGRAVLMGMMIWFAGRWFGNHSPTTLVLILVFCGLAYVLLDYCDRQSSFFSVIRSH